MSKFIGVAAALTAALISSTSALANLTDDAPCKK
jgi:hypothetical protein